MRLRTKLIGTYSLMAGLVGAVSGVGVVTGLSTLENFRTPTEDAAPQRAAIAELEAQVRNMERQAWTSLLLRHVDPTLNVQEERAMDGDQALPSNVVPEEGTPTDEKNVRTSLLESQTLKPGSEWTVAHEAARAAAARYQARATSLEEMRLARSIAQKLDELYASYIKEIQSPDAARLSHARSGGGAMESVGNALEADLGRAADLTWERWRTERHAALAAIRSIILYSSCGGLIALVAAILLGSLTTRTIARPIERLQENVERWRNEDFDGPLPLEVPQELGVLAATLKSAGERLRERHDRERQTRQELERLNASLRQTHEQALENERRLRRLMDSTAEALCEIDLSGRFAFVNHACVELLGYETSKDLVGRMSYELLAPHKREGDAPYPAGDYPVYRTLQTRARVHVDDEAFRRADGADFPVEYWSCPIERDDRVTGAAVTFRDLTDRRRAEDDLRRAREELEHRLTKRTADLEAVNRCLKKEISDRTPIEIELKRAKEAAEGASRAKSDFLAGMSHELRTPLNGVIGMTKLLLTTELDPKQQHYARIAKTSADTLLGLINDILDISKIEAGKLELEELEFDAWSVIEDGTDIIAHQAAEKCLELSCFIDPRVPSRLRGDPGRLRQIFVNLMSNAVKFTSEGGVFVQAALDDETARDATLRLSVRDTGIGIPSDRLHRLFEPFSQVDSSTTRKYGGTGLGLRISKQLAQLMNGRIGVESRAGEGSTFWFTARFSKVGESAPAVPRRASHERLKGLRVLIVDDEASHRDVLRRQLIGWGMEAEATPDGPTALEVLRQAARREHPFHLVVLDLSLPGMDGVTLGETVRTDERMRDLPLILLSSLREEARRDRVERVGFCATLTKPLKPSLLLNALLEAADKNPSASRTRPPPAAAPSEAKRLPARLLLVEDNEINQEVALNILATAGHEVDVACNGRHAVEAVGRRSYDLILMDCQMPEMDGFEATRRIRELERAGPSGRRTPILALTANALQGDRDRCLNVGMDDYISKPLDPRILLKLIDQWLADAHAPASEERAGDSSGKESRDPTEPASLDDAPSSFDVEALTKRCLGKLDLMERLMRRFETDVAELLEKIQAGIRAGDARQAAEQAHALKGLAANVSAAELHRRASELERALKESGLENLDRWMEDLRRAARACATHVPRVLERLKNDRDLGAKEGVRSIAPP